MSARLLVSQRPPDSSNLRAMCSEKPVRQVTRPASMGEVTDLYKKTTMVTHGLGRFFTVTFFRRLGTRTRETHTDVIYGH